MPPLAWVVLSLVASAQAPATPSPPAAAEESAAYPVGPEDVLRVTVYGHEDLTQSVVIEPDGTFVYPLLGRVSAAGRTPRELEQELATRLGDGYVREPHVAVVVQAYRSHAVHVMGEVMKPGRIALPDAHTLAEALARAGPLTAQAGSEALILRPRAGAGDEVVRVSLARLQDGVVENNVLLRPGDTVVVPRAPRVFVSGQVRKPGAYPIAAGTTVRQAISLAEGFARRPRKTVRIVRKVDGRTVELKAGLEEPLRDEDTIVVGPGS